MSFSNQDSVMSELDLAFLEAARAVDLETSRQATGKLLDSVGNNHAGTYRSIALDAIPKFESILGLDSVWTQHAAIEALIDLCGSFEPDPDDGSSETLATALVNKVQSMKQRIEAIALGRSIASVSASELLELLW